MNHFIDILFLVGLIVFLSPFIVYLLVKVGMFAALKAKAEFKDKEEAHGGRKENRET